MICVKLEGHAFNNEIFDILKLFYPQGEIQFADSSPDMFQGIFISSRLEKAGGILAVETLVRAGGKEHVEKGTLGPETDRHKKASWASAVKREIKRQLYILLSRVTGREMPWGMLTGIRPAKIVHELLDLGWSKEEIFKKLKAYYLVSEEKARMVYHVAGAEKAILDNSTPEMVGIYIGIPFCPTRCLYCSFTSNPISRSGGMVEEYLKALRREVSRVAEIIKEKKLKIQSIYMGGGTPTSIDAGQLKELLDHIEASFDLSGLEEYTLEAGRPDSIDREKLEAIQSSRVDRISINPQSMNDRTLDLIGRSHSAEDIVEAYGLARGMGFGNINMDLIAGLPGEDAQMFENTLKRIAELRPESLTVHTMSVKRASRLNEEKGSFALTEAENAAVMVELAKGYAEAMGMHPYYLYRQKNILGNLENVGYCREGFESVYNVQIMEERQTILALGAGAITKVVYRDENRIERAFNVKNVEQYIQRLDEMIERKRALLYNG